MFCKKRFWTRGQNRVRFVKKTKSLRGPRGAIAGSSRQHCRCKKTGVSGSWKKQSKNPWLDTIGAELQYSQLSDNAGAYYDYNKISAKVSHEMKGENGNQSRNWVGQIICMMSDPFLMALNLNDKVMELI